MYANIFERFSRKTNDNITANILKELKKGIKLWQARTVLSVFKQKKLGAGQNDTKLGQAKTSLQQSKMVTN